MVKPESQNDHQETKPASIFFQIGIYSVIMFLSWLISEWAAKTFPDFPLPTPVVGLVMLYLGLTLHIIKLEWVENTSSFLISIIGFLFVPSGIQLAGTLGVLEKEGWKIIVVIILSTVILLVCVAYCTRLFIWLRVHLLHHNSTVEDEEEGK